MISFVLIGAGNRGRIYADELTGSGEAAMIAVVEPNEARREDARRAYALPAERCFADVQALFDKGKLADVCVISSMDRDHYAQAMAALELGYDLLLEKPIAETEAECIAIRDLAQKRGRKVAVCHVLRYAPFFRAVKAVVDSGRFGRVMTIRHSENIGNFHMAHSFVRGNWRNDQTTSPIILQKTCHDMDLLVWLLNDRCESLASYGSLRYFKRENAPEGSAERCMDCPVAERCRFDARKCYLDNIGSWPTNVLCVEQTEQAVMEAIRTGPYGRCVYRCDNNVCDHQVVAMRFAGGVDATFSMSAFTHAIYREIHIMFEDGELWGNDAENIIRLTPFPSNSLCELKQEIIRPERVLSGHGGGDSALVCDFLRQLTDPSAEAVSSIARSVESHLMAFAAEQSRLTGQAVSLDTFR